MSTQLRPRSSSDSQLSSTANASASSTQGSVELEKPPVGKFGNVDVQAVLASAPAVPTRAIHKSSAPTTQPSSSSSSSVSVEVVSHEKTEASAVPQNIKGVSTRKDLHRFDALKMPSASAPGEVVAVAVAVAEEVPMEAIVVNDAVISPSSVSGNSKMQEAENGSVANFDSKIEHMMSQGTAPVEGSIEVSAPPLSRSKSQEFRDAQAAAIEKKNQIANQAKQEALQQKLGEWAKEHSAAYDKAIELTENNLDNPAIEHYKNAGFNFKEAMTALNEGKKNRAEIFYAKGLLYSGMGKIAERLKETELVYPHGLKVKANGFYQRGIRYCDTFFKASSDLDLETDAAAIKCVEALKEYAELFGKEIAAIEPSDPTISRFSRIAQEQPIYLPMTQGSERRVDDLILKMSNESYALEQKAKKAQEDAKKKEGACVIS